MTHTSVHETSKPSSVLIGLGFGFGLVYSSHRTQQCFVNHFLEKAVSYVRVSPICLPTYAGRFQRSALLTHHKNVGARYRGLRFRGLRRLLQLTGVAIRDPRSFSKQAIRCFCFPVSPRSFSHQSVGRISHTAHGPHY